MQGLQTLIWSGTCDDSDVNIRNTLFFLKKSIIVALGFVGVRLHYWRHALQEGSIEYMYFEINDLCYITPTLKIRNLKLV